MISAVLRVRTSLPATPHTLRTAWGSFVRWGKGESLRLQLQATNLAFM